MEVLLIAIYSMVANWRSQSREGKSSGCMKQGIGCFHANLGITHESDAIPRFMVI